MTSVALCSSRRYARGKRFWGIERRVEETKGTVMRGNSCNLVTVSKTIDGMPFERFFYLL